MTAKRIPLPAIDNAIREVYFALEEKNYQPPSWTSMTEDDLWRELVACILGSRVRFEVAHSAVKRMERQHLFCEHRRSSRFQQYEQDVMDALSERESHDEPNRYPFFRVRANQIRRAAEQFYKSNYTLRSYLEDSRDIRVARRRLALEVSGIGPKQASLFLRNIGYATHIAVLDVHVLTYMYWVGLTEMPVGSVPTVRKYEALENAFIEHVYSFGYTPDRFDLAVWIVVKVAKEEQKTWE
jgi:N-glycosylase/DNA lyase